MRKLLLTILYLFSCLAAQDKNTENILFIGNSFTFYWNLPLVVEAMANERNYNYDVLDPIQHALKPLVDKTGSVMVPIDQAFRIFQQSHPNIPIFMSDNKHPSPVGTYLAACVYFRIFTGESPMGLSRRYERKDENGKKYF